ncbi:MAG: helix-turn-helix domain-containing protein [Gammaproteobacteria bacterium]|jgi:hypothetical protein|nr:helix-turn-helix domain-containing protein [Gammaproteobacteria bacterium]
MAMFKKYNPRRVKSYKSYTLQEISRLYKTDQLHIKTIRAWINSRELNYFKDGNKYLIYGAVLKQFLFNRNQGKSRRSLQFDEFMCCKCKQINRPLIDTILSVAIRKNGSILAIAMCPNCASEMNRFYKRTEIDKIFACFQIEADALRVLSDTSSSASNTHLNTNHKTQGSETDPFQFIDPTISSLSAKCGKETA